MEENYTVHSGGCPLLVQSVEKGDEYSLLVHIPGFLRPEVVTEETSGGDIRIAIHGDKHLGMQILWSMQCMLDRRALDISPDKEEP